MKPIFSCCILNGFNLSPSCCAVYPCPYHNMTTLRRVGQLTDLINIKPLIYRRVHYTGNFIILFKSPPSIYDHQRTKCIPVSPPLIQRFTSQLTWIIIHYSLLEYHLSRSKFNSRPRDNNKNNFNFHCTWGQLLLFTALRAHPCTCSYRTWGQYFIRGVATTERPSRIHRISPRMTPPICVLLHCCCGWWTVHCLSLVPR